MLGLLRRRDEALDEVNRQVVWPEANRFRGVVYWNDDWIRVDVAVAMLGAEPSYATTVWVRRRASARETREAVHAGLKNILRQVGRELGIVD